MPKFPTTLALIIGALLLIVFTSTAWLACLHKNATIDEPGHFISAWIMTHYNDFRCNCENPPPWKYFIALGTRKEAMPIDRASPDWARLLRDFSAEWTLAREALYDTPGVNADGLIRAARARMLVIGVVVGAVIGWWAWRLGGAVAAVVAMSAFCLDPNFLAHSPLIKNDVSVTLALLLLSAGIWMLGERVTAWRWFGVSLLLGLAVTAKMSGILGVIVLGLMLLIRALMDRPWALGHWLGETRPQRLAAAAIIFAGSTLFAWAFIWASYGFRYNPSPDPSQTFDLSYTLDRGAQEYSFAHDSGSTLGAHYMDYNRQMRNWRQLAPVRLIFWAMAHRLLPQSYLNGLLIDHAMSQSRVAFLCGQLSLVGWWYYFPLAMIFKTPLTTLIALAAAAAFVMIRLRHAAAINAWPLIATATTPVLYMLAAMHSHLNIGLRHVLPVYPFLFIFLGVAASMAWRTSPRLTVALMALLIGGLAAEVYAAYPDFVPFFNVAVGGARGGVNLLGDSNIDLGENLPALAAWQKQHPDTPLYLLYWSTADPNYYGIRFAMMFTNVAPPQPRTASGPAPVVAVGAAILTDPSANQLKPAFFDALRREQPIGVLGGSIYLYHLP